MAGRAPAAPGFFGYWSGNWEPGDSSRERQWVQHELGVCCELEEGTGGAAFQGASSWSLVTNYHSLVSECDLAVVPGWWPGKHLLYLLGPTDGSGC